MIQVIYGPKGAGKTKRLIEMANAALTQTRGAVCFIDDDARYRGDIKYQIRFVDASEYDFEGEEGLYGFLCGMAASNFDLSMMFVDGFVRLAKKPIEQSEVLFMKLNKFSQRNNLHLVISISAPQGTDAPSWLMPFII